MLKIILSAIAASLLALSFSNVVRAQSRVFVGISGNDTNPCTAVAPCRTFQRAHDVVAANGEIDVLDPAGYGIVTISKAISIQGHGFSGITASGGATAITINAGASDKINLRGLVIEGFGTGDSGIIFNTGAALNVQDSTIRTFANRGIDFRPTAASQLNVSRTLVSDLGGAGEAITINPLGSGAAKAVLDHVELDHGDDGLVVNGNGNSGIRSIEVTITDSVVSHYGAVGIFVFSGGGGIGVMVRNCTVSNNGTGISSSNAVLVQVSVSRSTISGNGTGWSDVDGSSRSYGDNNVVNNGSDGGAVNTIGYQ